MRKIAMLVAAGVLAATSFANTAAPKKAEAANKYWVINVGLFKGTSDLEDAGVDNGFTGSIDYFFGTNTGNGNTAWYAGVGGFSGEGDNDLKFRSFGVHVGVLIGFGKPGDDNPWALDLRGGWYETRVEGTNEVETAGTTSFDDKESGFGGSAAIVFKSKSGPRFSLGWFMTPEVNGDRGNGYFFTIGFPFGGK